MTAKPAGTDEGLIERLETLAELFVSLCNATECRMITVLVGVAENGVAASEISLQQLLIHTVLFA